MALVSKNLNDDDYSWPLHHSIWNDRFSRNWDDWPLDWPRPRELAGRVSKLQNFRLKLLIL